MASKWTPKEKIIAFMLLLALFILLVILLERRFSIASMKDYVASLGYFAPIVLFVIVIVTSSVGFIYQIPVAVAALLLDIKTAFIISLLGLTVGAAISFSIARYFGRAYVEKKFISQISFLGEYNNRMEKEGFWAIFFFRLISIIPFELVNLAGGFSRISFMKFISATLLGIIPGTIIAVYFARTTSNLFSAQFFFAAFLNMAFAIIPLLFPRVRRLVFNTR